MILDVYKDAIEYALKDWKTLLKLGLMYLFGFLIFPLFFVYGYSFRVVKVAVNGMIGGEDELPPVNDFKTMFIDGIRLFIVRIAYLIIPVIIVAVLFYLTFSFASSNNPLFFALIVAVIVIYIIISIIFSLMKIIAISNMAVEGSLSSAFDFKTILAIINSMGWFRLFIAYLGLSVILFTIFTLVSLIISLISVFLGISGTLVSGIDIANGIVGAGTFIKYLILLFLIGPYLNICEFRAIGLMYYLQ